MSFSALDGRARGWDQARAYAERLFAPAFGRPIGAMHPSLHPSRDVVAATAEVRTSLDGGATSQVALFSEGNVELIRPGHRPAWSPDGTRLAHLVDGGVHINEARLALRGCPERLAWSPDGTQLLVVLAEPGSELSNIDSSGLLTAADAADAWLPHVSSAAQHVAWRRLVVIDVATLRCSVVGRPDLNVWDACWAGPSAVVAVCTDGSPTESAWYRADLRRIDMASGADSVLVVPAMQFGAVAASPSGRHAAYVEAVASDRDIAAGSLHLLDLTTGDSQVLSVPADVTDVQFLDDDLIGYAGLRGLTTVVGTVTGADESHALWTSEADSIAGIHPHASIRPGRTAFVRGGYTRPPEVCLLRDGDLTAVASMAHPGTTVVTEDSWTAEVRRWTAPDGLEVQGWLLAPATGGPHPLIVWIHGGPVWSHRTTWPASNFLLPYLLSHGYAVLHPNPRGSSGRGREFAAAVVGDMGGADTWDIRAGVEHLIATGVADPDRIGVMGGSYGGYMTAWLVTQCDLFAAAVAMYPITDWTYQHGASSIPYFDELFLDGHPYAKDGLYRERSPIEHVDEVRTPTLFIAGDRDRATPAGQALAMHRALVERQVPSECVIFPLEGHGARNLSAVVDVTARVTDWFAHWMPA
jgi:dipeptidyl aminopeptidase/acylaminoacyl peptidase